MGLAPALRHAHHDGQRGCHGNVGREPRRCQDHKLLRLGDARDTMSDNPETNAKKINKALVKIFKKHPSPSK
jgi:hypothetical protein